MRSLLSVARMPRGLLAVALAATLLPGCDSAEDPAVREVFVIGTRVPVDFLDSGDFELVATALDGEGVAILLETIEAEVEVLTPSDVATTTTFGNINTVSGDPLAISLVLDGSGSMASTDPERLRVDGAQSFVERLDDTPGLDWEASVYTYSSGYTRQIGYSADVDSLSAAIARVGASGSTETYETLLDVLSEGSDERPRSRFEPAIVLLSDGYPNSTDLRDDVCDLSLSLQRPIFAIGLGPASDLSSDTDPAAVEEMREIARCTNSAYAGIAADDPAAIEQIYTSIATATAQGSVSYRVRVSGPGFAALNPGDEIRFRLTLTSGSGTASQTFSFTAPGDATRRPGRGGPAE